MINNHVIFFSTIDGYTNEIDELVYRNRILNNMLLEIVSYTWNRNIIYKSNNYIITLFYVN